MKQKHLSRVTQARQPRAVRVARALRTKVDRILDAAIAPAVAARPDSHPNRYPKHPDPDKGQVYGGICNITACDREGAVWWNRATHGLYCENCANGINFRPGEYVCVPVDAKPTAEEMTKMASDMLREIASRG